MILEARGGVEPRAFPPSSCRFGLEDRRRERGPNHFRFPIANFRLVWLTYIPWCEYQKMTKGLGSEPLGIRKLEIGNVIGRAVRPRAPLRTPRSQTVPVLPR